MYGPRHKKRRVKARVNNTNLDSWRSVDLKLVLFTRGHAWASSFSRLSHGGDGGRPGATQEELDGGCLEHEWPQVSRDGRDAQIRHRGCGRYSVSLLDYGPRRGLRPYLRWSAARSFLRQSTESVRTVFLKQISDFYNNWQSLRATRGEWCSKIVPEPAPNPYRSQRSSHSESYGL